MLKKSFFSGLIVALLSASALAGNVTLNVDNTDLKLPTFSCPYRGFNLSSFKYIELKCKAGEGITQEFKLDLNALNPNALGAEESYRFNLDVGVFPFGEVFWCEYKQYCGCPGNGSVISSGEGVIGPANLNDTNPFHAYNLKIKMKGTACNAPTVSFEKN
jgi:hypothetical protein